MFTPETITMYIIIICRHGEQDAILGAVSSVYLSRIRKRQSKSTLYIFELVRTQRI